ncbi:hypothetical protein GCM10023263_64380 [Phytohabitans rumicis]
MRMLLGLAPNPVTSVSVAADAGCASVIAQTTASTIAATVAHSILIFVFMSNALPRQFKQLPVSI